MDYIQPTSGAEQNFGFGDLNNAVLRLTGTLEGGTASSHATSTPLALVPNLGGPVASLNAPFPWWLVVVAIGVTIIFSNGR
jgi:hypothetical protein